MPKTSPLHFAVLATDTVLFTLRDGELLVRLIPVNIPGHFVGLHGLPGGLIQPNETADQAAQRHLVTKAGISAVAHVEQLYTFSAVNRDPRGRVVTVAYLALVPWNQLSVGERADTDKAEWYPVKKLPKLAYDHTEIIRVGLERFASKIAYSTLLAKILPKEFTLTELEQAYSTILKSDLDKRNFRKKILKLGLVKKLNKKRIGLKQRPASLFSFASSKIQLIDLL